MSVIPDDVRRQLQDRFQDRLRGPVHLTLYTRPGSSRLILPAGYGCATCDEARRMAQLLRDAAPLKLTLEEIDITRDPDRKEVDEIDDVPVMALASDSQPARVRFQGLPTGTEFPALIDAVERVSRGEHGLSQSSVALLQQLAEPTEIMVFATPT